MAAKKFVTTTATASAWGWLAAPAAMVTAVVPGAGGPGGLTALGVVCRGGGADGADGAERAGGAKSADLVGGALDRICTSVRRAAAAARARTADAAQTIMCATADGCSGGGG